MAIVDAATVLAAPQKEGLLVAQNSTSLAFSLAQQNCTEIVLDPSGQGVRRHAS